MIAGLTKGDKAAEAGDQFEKHFCIGPTSLNREVYYSTLIYHTLKELYSQLGDISYANKTGSEKEIIDFYVLPQFAHFKEILDEGIKKDPLFANSAIVKFCYSIIKDNKLFKELEEMNIPAKNSSVKARISFQLKNLKEKVWFLRKLKEKKNFTCVQGAFGDGWSFYDLINDRDFKQTYIDKAVTESANKSFKEDIDKCIELAEQGKKTASKYFERKDVELQAYYTETDNAHRVLNVNFINYNRSEPTRISDILQQEKDIKKLNIYCNKKHEIYAYQEDKKRYYEFKEGACYEMTSTWPIKDEFGNVSICTMIMNVSSDRITEVLKFNGEDFVSSEEILELIKQNDELYIQGLSLYNAVMKSLEKGKAADVVPINFHNESIVAYQNKEPEEKLDHKVDADNSLPPSINSNASTQTKVKLQQIATQTEINSQQMDELILNNQMLSEENVELKQEIEAETNQAIVRLERRGSNLKDELEEEILKFDIEESENKYEEFPEDMMLTLELTKDNACNNDDIIEMLNGLKEEIRADGQRSLNDQFYILKEGVSNELDNESCVPLKEKTTLRRSLSFDGGYGSDKENCDDDLSSNISSISSVEKVAESRNVGKALL
ncbi:hypothetical protein [Wolbachia endosymbiont of Aedes albopictus]|uniref:hypothetical protein n=1 Tax=Wolbachia endosymbiont of Aedes albopictus TaxID=167957 RepID=UPI000BBBD88B|nr:hypothetical protein [Wolbachia endosymbiont of Aedes albopictus]UVW83594.1 hypothetical protein NHG98_04420 [Wolbachia endosymbiont of Aedes albopictus]